MFIRIFCIFLAITSFALAKAQQPDIKRIPLQTFDVPDTHYQTVIGIAEIAADATTGRHTHPGPEAGYIMEGEVLMNVEGKPQKALHVGDSYQIPAGVIHEARAGNAGAKALATYVVEKDKPLVSPAQ